MTERKVTETTESEAKSPQECPHCGAFYDNADSFKDHVEQHEREGTGDNAEKDRQNQDYPEGWQGETAPRGEEPEDADSVDYEWEEDYFKEGESKASESAYDKAKWLAKAKLEEGGLDIVSALPDIITDIIGLEDYQGSGDLTGAIEEAIAEYKESISTGMSMWGNIKSSETEPKLDTVEAIDDYVKNANEDATGSDIGSDYLNKQLMELPYDEQQDRLRTARDEQSPLDNIYHSDRTADRIASGNAPTYAQRGISDFDNLPINKDETKLDTIEGIDDYIKEGTDPAPYEEEEMPETIKQEIKDKDEAEEIIGALAMNSELEGIKDTYGSSANADTTTQPLEDHSGNDDSSDAITEADTEDEEPADNDDEMKDGWRYEDTVEESFGDCGCKDTKKARMSWESASENDKQYWLRDMGADEGYSYYYFEHLPKRIGESLVNKFKVDESEDRGWSKIPALERADLLKKLGFPPRDAELVANLEYPQLSESLKKDVNDAVSVKKRAEESQREKPDEQLSFENDLYSNMYDGYLNRRGQRVESKKNEKF